MEKEGYILVADDDPAIAHLLREVLERENFEVRIAIHGGEALEAFSEAQRMNHPFDLVILDIMMPVMNGFETCRAIRKHSEVPVLFLSAKSEESDQVVAFTLGADDYVVKPFKGRELVARVRARLRRRSLEGREFGNSSSVLMTGPLEIDTSRHEARLYTTDLALTPKEFSLLRLLMENAGKPVSAKQLFEGVWHEPYHASDSNTIMVHIRRLRKKLAAVDNTKQLIETVFGVGYKVEACEGFSLGVSAESGSGTSERASTSSQESVDETGSAVALADNQTVPSYETSSALEGDSDE